MNNFCLPEGVQMIGGKFTLVADGIERELSGLRHGEKRLRTQAIRMQILKTGRVNIGQVLIPRGQQLFTVKNRFERNRHAILLYGDGKGIVVGIAAKHIFRQTKIYQSPGQLHFFYSLWKRFVRSATIRQKTAHSLFPVGREILLQEEQSLNHRAFARTVHARQQRQRAKVYPLALKALEIRQLHTVKHAAPPESACEFLQNGI